MKHTKEILLFLLTACLLTACCSDDDPLDNYWLNTSRHH